MHSVEKYRIWVTFSESKLAKLRQSHAGMKIKYVLLVTSHYSGSHVFYCRHKRKIFHLLTITRRRLQSCMLDDVWSWKVELNFCRQQQLWIRMSASISSRMEDLCMAEVDRFPSLCPDGLTHTVSILCGKTRWNNSHTHTADQIVLFFFAS